MYGHHIFFHSLVIEPEKAFVPIEGGTDFETWMITVSEYKAILESLYERNYVLVKMADFANGKVQLPEGKIPLVISFDDVNYYDYMKGYGFADKLCIDENGEIANEVITEDGSIVISTEADGVAILEQFIKTHPDFSYNGARGILAVTGFQGVLGYRDVKGEKEKIKKLADAIKAKGFEFACHSYSHKGAIFNAENPDMKLWIEDIRRWVDEIEPVLGKTDIYIPPFGNATQPYPEFEAALKEMGFMYSCEVYNSHECTKEGDFVYFPRVNIDGYLFKHRRYEFDVHYGDSTKIMDKKRTYQYPMYQKDAKGLVAHARVWLYTPNTYAWGGLGEVITEEYIQAKKIEYPDRYDEAYCNRLRKHVGKNVRGIDCSGLIKNYLMGGIVNYEYDGTMDMNTYMMQDRAEKSGTMDTFPDIPGVCVVLPGHIGIYVGNQKVIESTSNEKFGCGVVVTKLSDREWTHWICCPGISYDEME